MLGRGGAQGLDLSATWQQDPASCWRVSVAGLAARDTVETIDRHWAGGLIRHHARTEQAPRWRVQWMHRFVGRIHPMNSPLSPFRIAVADDLLDDLRQRLRRTRWPEAELVDDWSQGAPRA